MKTNSTSEKPETSSEASDFGPNPQANTSGPSLPRDSSLARGPSFPAEPVPTESIVKGPSLPGWESIPQFPVHTTQQNVNLLLKNKILLAAVLVYGINLTALALAYATSSYDVASTMASLTFYGGIVGALLLGAGIVQVTLDSINHHGGTINGMVKLGILLLVLSIVFGLFTLVPGLALLLVGVRRPTSSQAPMSEGMKIALVIGTFIGGGITGVVVSFAIYYMTAERACQLSSSKCF